MLIVNLSGGLGNQMFQYFFAKYLEKTYKQKVYFNKASIGKNVDRRFELDILDNNISFYNEDIFTNYSGIKMRLLKLLFCLNSNNMLLTEKNISKIEYVDVINKKVLVVGYWQDVSFITSVFPQLSFSPKPLLPMPILINTYKNEILAVNSVFIHIRRGDYFSSLYVDRYGVCSTKYYLNAIEYVMRRVENPYFYIFSDDIAWVKNNLRIKSSVDYIENVEGLNSYYYIYLMSLCKHSIISNSSFSWWGAFLNDYHGKIVIAPDKWENGTNKDMALKSWIKLPVA